MPGITIPLKVVDHYEQIPIDEVVSLRADGNYCTVTLTDRQFIAGLTLKDVHGRMNANPLLIRVHKKHVVNLLHIRRVVDKASGTIELTDSELVVVSRRKWQEFIKQWNEFRNAQQQSFNPNAGPPQPL